MEDCWECSRGLNGARKFCSDKCRIKNDMRMKNKVRSAIDRGAMFAVKVDPIEIFCRDGWSCACCKMDTPRHMFGVNVWNCPTIDHIVPVSNGGYHTRDNIVTLCAHCNNEKSVEENWQELNKSAA